MPKHPAQAALEFLLGLVVKHQHDISVVSAAKGHLEALDALAEPVEITEAAKLSNVATGEAE